MLSVEIRWRPVEQFVQIIQVVVIHRNYTSNNPRYTLSLLYLMSDRI